MTTTTLLSAIALVLAVFAIIITSASAQPCSSCSPNCGSGGWNAQTFGDTTYYNGVGRDRGWSGTEQHLGNETYRTFTGPHGRRQNCTTQRFGNQAYTNCD